MYRIRRTMTGMCLAVVGLCAVAQGDDQGDKQPGYMKDASNWATVEQIMTTAANNIAKRYNLNDEQTEYTHRLMREGVTGFLKDNENRVWPVIRDLLAAQIRRPGDINEAMRIGKAARPLAELAEKQILEYNEVWRTVLTDSQKRLHDYDLAEMNKSFKKIYENFDSWAQGTPGDRSLFPKPSVIRNAPPRPPRPPKGLQGLPNPEIQVFNIGIFDTYVEEFIKDHNLSEGQIDSARSILVEFKTRAENVRSANKHDFARVSASLSEAIERESRADIRKATEQQKLLLRPIYALFGEMEGRLEQLLTTAQQERVAGSEAGKPDAKTTGGAKPGKDAKPASNAKGGQATGTKGGASGTKKKTTPTKPKSAGKAKPKSDATKSKDGKDDD